ncbi:MAG: hypothetical protein GXP53_12665 [Deltaproteobacteria bacterium]|nr:hypothetical protein [Deltaproteobacteria bacterium]
MSIIIPREKPVVRDLNSYYLNVDRLIEHYQGDLATGAVYFKSPIAEGALFFDEDNLINGYYIEEKKGRLRGKAAIEQIKKVASRNNFSVSVFQIPPERIYFWANLSNSKAIYRDLSTEFTDLEGLIKKMTDEKLSGYIDVKIGDGEKSGFLFFYNGEAIGGASGGALGDESDGLDRSDDYKNSLIEMSRKDGGKFTVRKISFTGPGSGAETEKPAKVRTPAAPIKKEPQPRRVKKPKADPERIIAMLQELLNVLEKTITSDKRLKTDFNTLLNRKLSEKADAYPFLDPFAAEFKYASGKIIFTGKAKPSALVSSIVECVTAIAGDLGILILFRTGLSAWRNAFSSEINVFDIEL